VKHLNSEVIIMGKKLTVIQNERKRPKQSENILYIPVSFDEHALRVYLRMRLRRIIKSEFSKLSSSGKFYLVGEIDFELVKNFRDKSIISMLKGSTILVREDTIKLSRVDIREILVHELAHIFSSHHDEKFLMAMRYIGGKQRRLPIQL
jgi:predicted metal-dependent hydrolase